MPKLTTELLLKAYSLGVFPMAENRNGKTIEWFRPPIRGVIPLNRFHIPQSLKKIIKQNRFHITVNQHFSEIIRLCAEHKTADRQSTWINAEIENIYTELYKEGSAHSIEVWQHNRIVGGLYGVSIGAAFFGESMFSLCGNASKVALVYLVARLYYGRYTLLDTQWLNRHLVQFGAIEIPHKVYMEHLQAALQDEGCFMRLSPYCPADLILQLCNQTSKEE